MRSALLFLLTITLCAAPRDPDARLNRRLEQLRRSPGELYQFLYRMPKGGDLHNHLSGAVYAESYIDAAAARRLCVDRTSLTFALPPCTAPGRVEATEAATGNELRNALIDAFSMRNFVAGRESGHDHFFATFGKFQLVSSGDFIAEVVRRAAAQNESYLELMAVGGAAQAADLAARIGYAGDFDAARTRLENTGLAAAVQSLKGRIDRHEQLRTEGLGCSSPSPEPACKVTVRYLYQVLRESPPANAFAQTMLGFALAAADPRVVGVNFVQPEDGAISMRDYHLQMTMVDYAHRIYPSVHITLHAGELAPGLVPFEGLRNHIREAVELGHAERIGHGVSVLFEDDAAGLMKTMRDRRVPVEINVTSNDGILGVRGEQHPFPVYRRAGVPLVISTDDEGVSRSNLTTEYLRAVLTWNLNWTDLKQLIRNSIEYSFLPAAEKTEVRRDLDARLAAFERANQ